MALNATIYNFTVGLSDVDRGVYETFALKAARHPSESAEFLVVRVLASRSAGVLNIATGHSMSFRAMAELARQAVKRPVEIVPSTRANPVTHRHFDITALIAAFPDFRFTSPEDGVGRMVQALASE